MKFSDYETGEFFDEMFGEPRRPRAAASALSQFIDALPEGELWGRDYSDVGPIRGVILGGGGHSLKVSVDVARVAGAQANSS